MVVKSKGPFWHIEKKVIPIPALQETGLEMINNNIMSKLISIWLGSMDIAANDLIFIYKREQEQ